jgi:Fe-S-cluster containining protein
MDFDSKISRLQDIYRQFAEETAEFRQAAVCKPGCAYCCTEMGTVDITTLEGLLIRERLRKLKRPVIAKVTKQLNRDIRKKEKGDPNRCPFLQKNDHCQIYAVRPFSCRQLYSLKTCGAQGPTVHRHAVELAQSAIKEIQAIDDTGYSGHLSYVLHMLSSEKFLQVYQAGDFKPDEILLFGKSHNIVINHMVGKKQG